MATREIYCSRCEKRLNPRTSVALELDQRDGTYHDRGDVPAELSQGWFDFGPDCAAAIKANGGQLERVKS